MTLNLMLQTIAKNMADDWLRCLDIQDDIRSAYENGPWRYSSEEVAEMWVELTERSEDLKLRTAALKAVYDPSVAMAVFGEVADLVIIEMT
ncbi:MAG: hypothetical protein H0W28_07515 [Pyrinomonadaceae bacterium]|nr:hypothetical protein [Pyrinomonadaceae bacterium]